MRTLHHTLLVFGLTAAFAAHADPGTAPSGSPAAAPPAPHACQGGPRQHDGGPHHHHGGELGHVLHQLDLTPDQQGKVTTILAQSRIDIKALHGKMGDNRYELAATSPSDPGYPALLANAKANAAAWIQHESDVRKQIYAVLTPQQQARIPQIVAADRAAHEARMEAWRSKAPPQS